MFKQVVFKSLHGNFRKKVREPTLFPRALFVEKALGKFWVIACFKRKKKKEKHDEYMTKMTT